MTCTLDISTYSTDVSSSVTWYTKKAELEVDGGSSSKWREYETFVKMIAATATLSNAPYGPGSTGSNFVSETQSTTDTATWHSPVVNLNFGAVDVYSGTPGSVATAWGVTSGTITPVLTTYQHKLRRLPINNIDAADTVTLKVSITAGITMNTATTGDADACTLVASWNIDDVLEVTGGAGPPLIPASIAVPRAEIFKA